MHHGILFAPPLVGAGYIGVDGVQEEEESIRRKPPRRRIFVKYAVEISDLPLFSSRDVCKNKGYRIIGGKQCHSVNKCILFEITRMHMRSVNRNYVAPVVLGYIF